MIRDATADDHAALLALNAANVPEVGTMDAVKLDYFFDQAPYFKVVEIDGDVVGMLIGLTEANTDYPSKNYHWFLDRHDSFAYVDRVAIGEAARGQGWGPALYHDFQEWAVANRRPKLAAEVNTEPPNPRSLRFHEIFGFGEVDRFRPYGPDEEVAMVIKELTDTTIYRARLVRTVDPACPTAEAIAVRDGRILGVGTVEELSVWGPVRFDDTFADSVLVPGLIEAHSHVLEGGLWAFEYVGYFDRMGADGVLRKGCTNIEQVLDRLREINESDPDPTEPLIAWGLDPIYFDGEDRLVAAHLDTVSETRPIFVFHASAHLATVNSALMRAEGIEPGIDVEGVPVDADGRPIGELQEPAAYSLARTALQKLSAAITEPAAIERFGQSARLAGCTTVTELGATRLDWPDTISTWKAVVDAPDFPARVSVFFNPGPVHASVDEIVELANGLAAQSTDKLHLGHVKMVLDGSIQGFTARLNWPGYLNGATGIWLYDPERFRQLVVALHAAGITIHTHCNGDQAVDLFLDAVAEANRLAPWIDHRHTVQHCQLTTPAQYRRMAAMGMCANIFANHLWYWGDQHHDITVGPDRAKRMDACGTAERSGVSFSMHSDAAITPLGQLHTMWCAVNRLTPKGRVLGEAEKISAEAALHAVTIGAAYQLHLDHEIGSIEPGKRADFTALSDDPVTVDPMTIRDITVHGTVVGGVNFRAD